MQLLASVRDVDEALCAADAGADLVDLKDPAAGALGALTIERIAQVVAVLRARYPGLPLSATTGDLPASAIEEILRRVQGVAACDVDYVKVGVWPGGGALLDALADCGATVVPVLVADAGINASLLDHALRGRAFPALMVDTADKGGGSLLRRVPLPELSGFIAAVRSSGRLAGLAGSLRMEDAPALRALAPDIAGFRGALTHGERAAALDGRRVRELRRRLAAGARAPLPAAA
ncbi:hypothetical protein HHL11_17695 [Ramlibacter sp. G-1-2-2]|uniref:(5-formylfuran-3-yl)methyl phosphate synthase n=2 Tax=Ramlibacter agri TaxID=2728837 RepID=A0A848H7Z2_9BURK|nr:hypothetical protein [Ramlibacter agri]